MRFLILIFLSLIPLLPVQTAEASEPEVVKKGIPVGLKMRKVPTMEPAGCLNDPAQTCSIQTTDSEKFELKIGTATVVLDVDTVVIRANESSLTLVEGTVWVRTGDAFAVTTEFGSAKVVDENEFWVRRDGERMRVSAIKKPLILEPRNSAQALRLEAGEENWLSGVANNSSVASSGVPQAIGYEEHIARWGRLYSGSAKDFKLEVEAFHSRWSRGLASLSEYHQSLAQGRIDALRADEQARNEARQKVEARSRELRDLFRRKVLLD